MSGGQQFEANKRSQREGATCVQFSFLAGQGRMVLCNAEEDTNVHGHRNRVESFWRPAEISSSSSLDEQKRES